MELGRGVWRRLRRRLGRGVWGKVIGAASRTCMRGCEVEVGDALARSIVCAENI